MPEALRLPWMNYLLVNAPDDYYGGFSWFDIEDHPPGVVRSRQMLFALLDDFADEEFCGGADHACGFSQGCLMSVDVGLRYPHRLAGIIGISGWVFELKETLQQLSPVARQQRFLMTHGTSDPVIPIERVRPQIPVLKAAGINVTWQEFAKVHTIQGEIEMAVIRNFVTAGYA